MDVTTVRFKNFVFCFLIVGLIIAITMVLSKVKLDQSKCIELMVCDIVISSEIVFHKCTKKSIANLIFFEILFLSLPLLYGNMDGENFFKFFMFSSWLSVFVTGCNYLVSNIPKTHVLRVILCFVVLLPNFFCWIYYYSTKHFISCDTILAVIQTNYRESIEYIKMNFSMIDFLLFFFSMSLLLIIITWLTKNGKDLTCRFNEKIFSIFLLITMMYVGGFYTCKYRENIITESYFETIRFLDVYKRFDKYSEERLQKIVNVKKSTNCANGTYVLVIGESLGKEHMSRYGYNRKTTPWLDSMYDDKHSVLFNNIFSCHTHTVPVLVYALTQKNQYNDIPLHKALTLIEICKLMGYECIWLSNQVKYGGWDSPITSIALGSQQQKWINKNIGLTTATNSYDEKLVECLDNVNIKDNMLIVIHLMGSHGWYGARYPKNFTRFKGKNNTIDCYDNSVLYSDYVVRKIYEKCKKIPDFMAMIYLSDHADDVDTNRGHDSSKFTPAMTHVPMYMVASDRYMKNYPDNFKKILHKSECVMTNDLLFNFMLSIMMIRVENIYEPINDLLNEKYNTDIRRFKTLHGKRQIM